MFSSVTKLNLGQDNEARFGQDFKFKFSLEIFRLMHIRDSEDKI